jgi:hypothetical protein
MIVPALQTIALLLACLGVWKLCRHLRASASRLTFLIIAGGLLFRVAVGCALFWISYLELPLGLRFQLGRGFWFFAPDGRGYFDLAATFASKGLLAIASVPGNQPSPVYVQVLALFEYTFGIVAAVGILLNAICYLITATVLVWLSRRDARLTTPVNVALLVLSFAPGCALWSLQPLKDSFFVCVLTLFVAACVAWQDLWLSPNLSRRGVAARVIALAAAFFALTYAVSSVRWYTALALLATLPLFAIAIAMGCAARRRVAGFLATAGLMIICSQAILMASTAYLPRPIATLLRPASFVRQQDWRSVRLGELFDRLRHGFDRTPGATAIAAGTLIPASKPPAPAAAVETPAADPVRRSVEQGERAPVTRGGRIVTGVAAAFLPRTLAQSLGLLTIEGGRGLWLVADADTLMFDALLIFVIVFCVRQLRVQRMRVAPAMVLVFVSMLAIGGPLIYIVSNFGTLFRLRQMITLQLCLIPLVMTVTPRRGTA